MSQATDLAAQAVVVCYRTNANIRSGCDSVACSRNVLCARCTHLLFLGERDMEAAVRHLEGLMRVRK
jgi:hypothetical protein